MAVYLVRAEYQTSRELAEQCLSRLGGCDPALLLEAHFALGGLALAGRGGLGSRLEQSIALYDPQEHRALAFHAGIDPGCGACPTAFALWLLGYPDQALRRSYEALVLAQELSHPPAWRPS